MHARIDSMNAIYDTCVRAHEMAFFQEWYMPDACSMPEGMPRVCGREAIAEFRWNHGDSRVFRLLLKAEEVSGGPDVVAEQGNYVVSTAGAALDKGKYIALWRRDADGKWKVHREIWNSDIPHDAPPDTLSKIEG